MNEPILTAALQPAALCDAQIMEERIRSDDARRRPRLPYGDVPYDARPRRRGPPPQAEVLRRLSNQVTIRDPQRFLFLPFLEQGIEIPFA